MIQLHSRSAPITALRRPPSEVVASIPDKEAHHDH